MLSRVSFKSVHVGACFRIVRGASGEPYASWLRYCLGDLSLTSKLDICGAGLFALFFLVRRFLWRCHFPHQTMDFLQCLHNLLTALITILLSNLFKFEESQCERLVFFHRLAGHGVITRNWVWVLDWIVECSSRGSFNLYDIFLPDIPCFFEDFDCLFLSENMLCLLSEMVKN